MGMSKEFRMVISIDLGTFGSGFAIGHIGDDQIKIDQGWTGENRKRVGEKVRTAILLKEEEDGRLVTVEFGENATFQYQRILLQKARSKRRKTSEVDDNNNGRFYLFDQFKMSLYQPNAEEKWVSPSITDVAGTKQLPAMEVISRSLGYLVDKAKSVLRADAYKQIHDKIKWVVTMPAVWLDGAKDFMLRACKMAGIPDDQLYLCLEPEAAAICCIHEASVRPMIRKGTRYVVLDMGGGTADVTCHTVVCPDTMSVKEICKVSGDDSGSSCINKAFMEALEKQVGTERWKNFQKQYPFSYQDLAEKFEVKKKQFDGKLDSVQSIFLKPKLAALLNREKNKDDEADENEAENDGKWDDPECTHMEFDNQENTLSIEGEFMIELHRKVRDNLCKLLCDRLQNPAMRGCQYVLLAGGASSSPYLRNSIQEVVRKMDPRIRVFHPLNASMAILKGAVLIGKNPSLVTSRKSRFSYAAGRMRKFDAKIHDEKRAIMVGDKKKIMTLDILVKMDEDVKTGAVITRDKLTNATEGTKVYESLYRCTRNDATYTDEDGVQKLGNGVVITFDRHYEAEESILAVNYKFGDTRIDVCATHKDTNRIFKGYVDYGLSLDM